MKNEQAEHAADAGAAGRLSGNAEQCMPTSEGAGQCMPASESAVTPGPSARETKVHLESLRERYMPAILGLIEDVVTRETPQQSTLITMCRYHLETGGKRLRALLPLMIAETLECAPRPLLPFAAACEVLHNATLVHDDIQDGDTHRRGRETLWRKFGIPQAINCGDAMFYYALLLMQRLEAPEEIKARITHRLLVETLRVIDGQELEFALKKMEHPSLEDYTTMVEQKTSGLFRLTLGGAAILCGMPDLEVDRIDEAANHLGVLFQMQDDVLDLYGDKGREARGTDIAEGKRSVLVVLALASAGEGESRDLLAILNKPREDTSREDIAGAMAILEQTRACEQALEEIARRRTLLREGLRTSLPFLEGTFSALCELLLEPIAFLDSHRS